MKDRTSKFGKDVEEKISKFFSLQEERVKTYREFELGNKEYLRSGPDYDFISYREVVNNITIEFKRISEGIIAIEKELRETGVTELADVISKVQDCEKDKLQLTVEHHMACQMVSDSDGSEAVKNTERELKQKIVKVIEDINDNLSTLRYMIYED